MIYVLCIFLYLFIGALAYNGMAEYEEVKGIYKREDIHTEMKILAVATWPLFIFWWWFHYLKKPFPFWSQLKWIFIWPFKLQQWAIRELLEPRENTPKKT